MQAFTMLQIAWLNTAIHSIVAITLSDRLLSLWPRIWFAYDLNNEPSAVGNELALQAFTQAITQGQVIAVKGVRRFYHLVCDALQPDAVARLRARKQRPEKPLAIMLPSVEQVQLVAHCFQS